MNATNPMNSKATSHYATGNAESALRDLGFSDPWELLGPAVTNGSCTLNGVTVTWHNTHWNIRPEAECRYEQAGTDPAARRCTAHDPGLSLYGAESCAKDRRR